MNSVLKFVQVFALGTWIGSIMYLSFIVAPGAFATLKDREQAGALVGYSLSRLHLVGMILGLLYLVTAFVLVSGLVLAAAFRLNIEHGRWWLVLGGVASIVYGVLLIVAPLIGALVLTWWFGAYALVFGIALLILAFRLKARLDPRRHPAVARGAT